MRRILITVVVLLGLLGVGVSSAVAAVPALSLSTVSLPKHLPPGGEGTIEMQLTNVGDAPATGEASPIVMQDKLPAGIEATSARPVNGAVCSVEAGTVVRCEYQGSLVPFGVTVEVEVAVRVSGSLSGALVNEFSAVGGGAIDTHTAESVVVSGVAATNGLEKIENVFLNEDGSPDIQAGSHPFEMVTTVVGATVNTKDVQINFPAGFVGNTNVVAQCTSEQFDENLPEKFNGCPADSAIGVSTAYLGPAGQLGRNSRSRCSTLCRRRASRRGSGSSRMGSR